MADNASRAGTRYSTPAILDWVAGVHTPQDAGLARAFATPEHVPEQESLKNALIVLGGPDVSYNLELYLQHGADLNVVGEGEQTLLEIVQAEGDFSQIPGIAFRLPDGSVFKTKTREKIGIWISFHCLIG